MSFTIAKKGLGLTRMKLGSKAAMGLGRLYFLTNDSEYIPSENYL